MEKEEVLKDFLGFSKEECKKLIAMGMRHGEVMKVMFDKGIVRFRRTGIGGGGILFRIRVGQLNAEFIIPDNMLSNKSLSPESIAQEYLKKAGTSLEDEIILKGMEYLKL